MAKFKNAKELIKEADDLIKGAKKKQAELLREAKEIESKNLAQIGVKTIEFFNGKCDLKDVENLAHKLELLIPKDDKAFDKKSDVGKEVGAENE